MTPTTPLSADSVKKPRWIWAALALSVGLCVLGLLFFFYATRTATGPERGTIHKVVVNDSSCEPMNFSLEAGLTSFEIHNASRRPIEWEILDGVMVVAERENIAPGFHSMLTVKLRPGNFIITCGLLSNPRGTLVVTPTAASEAERLRPPVQAFIGPLSENRVYSITQSNRLLREVNALNAALEAQDLSLARSHWWAARSAYKRIEAIAGRFADTDARINPQAQYLQNGQDDAQFMGLPKLGQLLFGQAGSGPARSTADIAQEALAVSQTLAGDVTQLQTRIRDLQQRPDDLTDNAIWLLQRLDEGALAQPAASDNDTQLPDLQANLEGIRKSVLLLNSLLQAAQPDQAKALVEALDAVQTQLDAHKPNAEFVAYDQLSQAQQTALVQSLRDLGAQLLGVNKALGLE